MLLIRHTDAEREWAYDDNRRSDGSIKHSMKRKEMMDVVDMKKDWKRIFPFQ